MARALIDMTGQRFGRWTVRQYQGRVDGQLKWECVCDCGNVKDVNGGSLRSGASTSCGVCTRANLVGAIFGSLRPIKKNGPRGKHMSWICECLGAGPTCKGRHIATTNSLKRGSSTSCGCLTPGKISQKLKSEVPIGRVYADLEVTGDDPRPSTRARWLCRCLVPGCGNVKSVRAVDVVGGRVLSCGCMKIIAQHNRHAFNHQLRAQEAGEWDEFA